MKIIFIFILFFLNFVFIENSKTCDESDGCDPSKDGSIDDNSIDNSEEKVKKDDPIVINDISEQSVKPKTEKSTEKSIESSVVSKENQMKDRIHKHSIQKSIPTPEPTKERKNFFPASFGKSAKAFFKGRKSSGSGDVVLKSSNPFNQETSGAQDSIFTQFKNSYGRVCYNEVGCFNAIEYNDFTSRPTTVLPQSPDIINAKFMIYTPDTRTEPRNFTFNATQSQLRYSNFNQQLKTIMIIHGYQSGLSLWMENMKDFLQYQSGDAYNVILVDWERGAKPDKYNIAVANTRVLAACISIFINTLYKTFEIKKDSLSLIGHCLGAHVAGFVGKRFTETKMSRITALDPSGIGFSSSDPSTRLDSSDASLVDVIHTDIVMPFTDGFGIKETIGHFDYYPNGGAWQPGCAEASSIALKLATITNGEEITCSHSRASSLLYNLDKPEDDCSALAYECPNYEMFLEGRCADCRDNKCRLMGINPNYWENYTKESETIGRKYYIQTSNTEEFCLYHYQFGVHISHDSDSTTGNLIFTLNIKITETETKDIIITKIMSKTSQDKIHTFLLTIDYKILEINSLSLKWQRYDASERYRVNRGYKLKVPFIEINFMSDKDESIRKKHSSIFCSDNSKIIVNRDVKVFKLCQAKIKLATETKPGDLNALEFKNDIYAVDLPRGHRTFHKIVGTRIKEKIKRNQIVD